MYKPCFCLGGRSTKISFFFFFNLSRWMCNSSSEPLQGGNGGGASRRGSELTSDSLDPPRVVHNPSSWCGLSIGNKK